jgi:hypothetical protein
MSIIKKLSEKIDQLEKQNSEMAQKFQMHDIMLSNIYPKINEVNKNISKNPGKIINPPVLVYRAESKVSLVKSSTYWNFYYLTYGMVERSLGISPDGLKFPVEPDKFYYVLDFTSDWPRFSSLSSPGVDKMSFFRRGALLRIKENDKLYDIFALRFAGTRESSYLLFGNKPAQISFWYYIYKVYCDSIV